MERKNILIANSIDESFIVRRESDAMASKRRELAEKLTAEFQKTIKKAMIRKLPALGACLAGGVLSLIALESGGTLRTALTALSVVLFAVGIVLAILNRKKEKAEENKPNEELVKLDALYQAFDEEVKGDLGVPADAVEIGLFTESGDLQKDGKPIYSNYNAFAFVENDTLCFWQYGEILGGIPLSEIECLAKINAPITFDNWKSDEEHDSPKYAQYGIQYMNENGEFTMTGYYSLRITHENEPFEVRFPLFDADALLALLNREMIEE